MISPTSHSGILVIAAAVLLASCSGPISYRRHEVPIPSGDFGRPPHSDAVGQLKAVRSSGDPRVAAGRFFDAARAAYGPAVAGTRRIVVMDTLKFRGRYAQAQAMRDGLGAPLAAILEGKEN